MALMLVLSLYIRVIPMNEWDMLSESGKETWLREGLKIMKQELQCEHPNVSMDIDRQFLYLYGECDKGEFIGSIQKDSASIYD